MIFHPSYKYGKEFPLISIPQNNFVLYNITEFICYEKMIKDWFMQVLRKIN